MSVVDAIERAIDDHPGRGAIETADRQITYRRFGERVREFASLVEARTAPDEFVGIEASRSSGSIVAMVGALMAERPFVVLDPRDSTASNGAKVAALGVNVVSRTVARSDTVELVGTPAQWRAASGDRPLAPPEGLKTLGGATGYAIHTSGSTGEPKCVLVAAGPLSRMVEDHVRRLSVRPQSRTLQFARLTFDGCITEILWTLTAGACLVVVDESMLTPGTVLQSTLENFRITHLKTTPYALTATDPTSAMSLQHVINGGGACRRAVVRKWSSVAGFHNAYGTTETTVCNLLSEELTSDDCADSVPLGQIVGDCGYDILALPADGDRAATTETRGEFVITGNSVAIGYLTAQGVQRFVDDDGNKVYRTGDVVERRDGQIFFVERRDRQLKVRGYRLDPGEIESAACRLDGVVEAVVTAESHGTEGSEADALVCYYQGATEPRAMRSHLEAVLDSYKVPSVITRVEALPYTPNGKVDRDALRAGRRPAPQADGAVSPDQQILELVRYLTGVGDAGLDDNFFDIGGDSASTVVLVNKLKELGWIDAGVRDVLRAENLKVLIDELRDRSM
jgi:non-ribosomal peptide synthetase component F